MNPVDSGSSQIWSQGEENVNTSPSPPRLDSQSAYFLAPGVIAPPAFDLVRACVMLWKSLLGLTLWALILLRLCLRESRLRVSFFFSFCQCLFTSSNNGWKWADYVGTVTPARLSEWSTHLLSSKIAFEVVPFARQTWKCHSTISSSPCLLNFSTTCRPGIQRACLVVCVDVDYVWVVNVMLWKVTVVGLLIS